MFPAGFRVWALLAAALWAGAIVRGATASRPAPLREVRLDGVPYVDAVQFFARFGLESERAGRNTTRFKSRWTAIELEADSRDQKINGLRVFFGDAVRRHRKKLWISRYDADELLTPILAPGRDQARVPTLRTIVLDPGHGGRDPGKVNRRVNVTEKEMALDTMERVKKLLEADGFNVILTRTDDTNPEFTTRVEVVERVDADLFISLHYNSVASGAERVTGVEVFTMTPQFQFSTSDPGREDEDGARKANPGNRHDHWNTIGGYLMHREMLDTLKVSDRGLKRARWKVLVLASCPAVYVEAGYLSNDEEARKIATPAYRQKIAEGVAAGVRAYAGTLAAARAKLPAAAARK